jgi:hypothetical protein
MVLLRVRAGSVSRREHLAIGALLLPTLAGLLAWWSTAPDPRYAFQLFYSLAICLAAWAIAAQKPELIGRWLAGSLAVPVVVLLVFRVHYAMDRRDMPLPEALVEVTLPVPVTRLGHSVLPEVALRGFTTDSGFIVHVPVNDDRVWDAPLPSSTSSASFGLDLRNLRLRDDDDLGAGFVMAKPTRAATAHP